MPDLRHQIVNVLTNDSVFATVATGGVYAKPIVPIGEHGYEAAAWVVDANSSQRGLLKPSASVTDSREYPDVGGGVIAAVEAMVTIVVYGPNHEGGKTACREMKERAYDVLNDYRMPLDVEGVGYADLQWRGSTETAESDRLPGSQEATIWFAASYLKTYA